MRALGAFVRLKAAVRSVNVRCGAVRRECGCGWSTTASVRLCSSSVDAAELHKFDTHARQWWDTTSKTFGPLHSMNAVRIPFIEQAVQASLRSSREAVDGGVANNAAGVSAAATGAESARSCSHRPLAGLSVLDVGCGGGILSESLARVGASVCGIDPGTSNITAARAHAALDSRVSGATRYVASSVEDFVGRGEQFDVVVSSEVIEHVADVPGFITCCASLVKSGGTLVLTTMNRTTLSRLAAITLAENMFGLVTRGTHDWDKFLKPDELSSHLEAAGLAVTRKIGFQYNPLCNSWTTVANTSVNYGIAGVKS